MNINNLKCKRSDGDSDAKISDAERINNEGVEKFEQGNFEDALERFSKSIHENNELTEAYYNRYVTYIHLGIIDFISHLSSKINSIRHSPEIMTDLHHFIKNVLE